MADVPNDTILLGLLACAPVFATGSVGDATEAEGEGPCCNGFEADPLPADARRALAACGFAVPDPVDGAARRMVEREVLTPGMPLAAMPVESLYKPWTSLPGSQFGGARGLYLGDAARHVQALYDGDPAAGSKEEVIFTYPGLYAIYVYRIAHVLYDLGVPIIPRVMTEIAHSSTGIDIGAGAHIGEYFFIDHGTGVVIGETTTIGDHVKLYQGVTLGALSTRGGQRLAGVKRHPTIEDNVTIYSNASVLGGETVIGEGSVIAGSTFVTFSVPPHSRVSVKEQEIRVRQPGERD